MIPYFLLIGLPVLAGIISKKYRFTSGRKLLYETESAGIDVFMILLMLLLGLRGTRCGTDTVQYLRKFHEYSSQTLSQLLNNYNSELGYKLLNWLIGTAGGNFQMVLMVTAILSAYPLWYFYKRESENQVLTIALFLSVAPYMMYFSGIRQAVAMGFTVPAWYCARDRKRFRFLVTVLLAMQFHMSAVMLFLLYPLYYANITKKWLWFAVPCMAAVYVFRTPIFHFLLTFLWREYQTTGATGATTVLFLLILFSVYAYILPEDKELDEDTIALRNILLLAIVIQIFAMLHPLSMRMNYYYLLFVPVLIPKIANRSKKQYDQIARLSVIVMTVYFSYYFLSSVITDKDSLNIFPYIPFWKN